MYDTMRYTRTYMKDLKEGAKALADNLELYNGIRSCKVCGIDPEMQMEMIEQILKHQKIKTVGDERARIINLLNRMPAFKKSTQDLIRALNIIILDENK